MTVVLRGLDLSPTPEWWGWVIEGSKVHGNVDPAARTTFFDAIAAARATALAAGNVKELHASGRYRSVSVADLAYDDATGVAVALRHASTRSLYRGSEVRFVYEETDPAMTWALGCCPLRGEVELPAVWSTVKFYNAQDPGGDAINWPGNLDNQGGSGDGANGTDYYNFKSALPDEFQNSWAATAGALYRVAGYVNSGNTGQLKLGFSTAAAGSGSGTFGGALLDETIVSPPQPGTGNTWVGFSAEVAAPVGTVSAALGRTGSSVSFDEVLIEVQT